MLLSLLRILEVHLFYFLVSMIYALSREKKRLDSKGKIIPLFLNKKITFWISAFHRHCQSAEVLNCVKSKTLFSPSSTLQKTQRFSCCIFSLQMPTRPQGKTTEWNRSHRSFSSISLEITKPLARETRPKRRINANFEQLTRLAGVARGPCCASGEASILPVWRDLEAEADAAPFRKAGTLTLSTRPYREDNSCQLRWWCGPPRRTGLPWEAARRVPPRPQPQGRSFAATRRPAVGVGPDSLPRSRGPGPTQLAAPTPTSPPVTLSANRAALPPLP